MKLPEEKVVSRHQIKFKVIKPFTTYKYRDGHVEYSENYVGNKQLYMRTRTDNLVNTLNWRINEMYYDYDFPETGLSKMTYDLLINNYITKL